MFRRWLIKNLFLSVEKNFYSSRVDLQYYNSFSIKIKYFICYSPYKLLQNNVYISLCCTAYLWCFFTLCINYFISLDPTPLLLLPLFSLPASNYQFVLYIRDSVSVLFNKIKLIHLFYFSDVTFKKQHQGFVFLLLIYLIKHDTLQVHP